VYGEPIVDARRVWDAGRSKLGAMLELGMDTRLQGGESVLYLGAASGTTVSHVADFAGPTYAVEFAPRPVRDLVDVAESRPNLFPLLADARKPREYAGVVESGLDCIVQDVATRGQADVANRNATFLADDGLLLAAIKARSEDVVAEPDEVFEDVRETLRAEYELLETMRLDRYHDDHLGIVARKR
jgi:fibrillarin-like pre-rRNA processing protein